MTKPTNNGRSKPKSTKINRESLHVTFDRQVLKVVREQAQVEKRSVNAQIALLVERQLGL